MPAPSLPIAIFDSGIGGLTVLSTALEVLPAENFVYYADTAHVPYGTRTREEVRNYILQAAAFLNDIGIKALLLACNTATSTAVSELRSIYKFPIIGMEPAVKPAVERTIGKKVLVLATQLTLQEQKFKYLVAKVDNEKIVDFLALPELVDLAEQFLFDEEIVLPALKRKFSSLNPELYGTIVLGCTHFLFFKNSIAKLFPPYTDIIDGNTGTVNHLKNTLHSGNQLSKAQNRTVTFYESGKVAVEERFYKYINFYHSLYNNHQNATS